MLIETAEGNLRELGVTLQETLITYPKYKGTIGYQVEIRSKRFDLIVFKSESRQHVYEKSIRTAIIILKKLANGPI